MESIETWVERLVHLLEQGSDVLPKVIKLIASAPSLEHIERLDRVLKRDGWYAHLGSKLLAAVRSRRAALQEAAASSDNDVDDDPSP
nr:hypothetical protein [uncultured Caldimonas sp.]